MSRLEDPDDLNTLGKRISAARGEAEEKVADEVPASTASMAWRIGAELVAGITVGGVLGYFLDQWIGSLPLFLMTGICLGAAAGIRNMSRTVNNSID